jgi:antitoxin PrlF
MSIAHSKITGQGQISVPAKVRQKLGIGPGSVLEWEEQGELILVRRAGRYTSEDIHREMFPHKAPAARSIAAMKEGVRRYVRKRHARD